MSGPKRGFSAFIRPTPPADTNMPEQPSPATAPSVAEDRPAIAPRADATEEVAATPPERVRQVTATGRVRTHSASRSLPGVTLRLTEERWERLKMLSIQERRPIQEILGEAMQAFMRSRGLPW